MSKRLPKTIALLSVAVAIPVAAAGCGSSSSNNNAANPTTTPASTAASTAAAGTVNVVLNEMNVVPDPAAVKAGKVTFDVKNEGQLPHEMVVLKTDKQADALGSGTKVPETGSIGETGDLAAGKSKSISFTLKPGHYVLICNLPGHYAAGMHANFDVS